MRHVLVIRLSALGDVAILAPVLKGVASANSGVLFTVAAPPLLEPLFGGMENVRFLGVKKRQPSWKIYRALKTVGADAVADLHQVNRVGRALGLLWADALLHGRWMRVSRLCKGRWSRFLMVRHWSRKPRRTQAERYGDVFRRLGLAVPPDEVSACWTVAPSKSATVGFAPFAQHRGKVWPMDRARRLVELLVEAGCRVVLFGSAEEAGVLEGWCGERVVSLAGKKCFAEELDAIRSVAVMVSMDSANMHFASALGVPVVSVWGATHPDFGFYGYRQARENAVCAGLACQPCSAYGAKACRWGDYRCLNAVAAEEVAGRVLALLDGAAIPRPCSVCV